MGQYFRLAAPRAREALSGGGKLGEILFNTSPTVLVYLLAVPVQPKKRLAASEVITKAVKTPTAKDLQSGGLASSSKQDDAVPSAKRKADTEEQLDLSLRNGKQAKTEATHTPATFCALSRELHELIFGFVKRLKDLACFGLTNTYFWDISHGIIQRRFASELGTWAGKHIVNVGDYTKPGDYPSGLFSPEEEKNLTNKMFQYYDGVGEQHLTPLTLYHLSESSEMVEAKEISTQSTRLLGGCMMRCQNSPTDSRIVRSKSSEIIHANDSAFLPRDQAWILRNLTTKEFVTAVGIALDAKYIDGPFIGCIGFGEVVMSRICWSSDPSISMPYTGEIWRGVWAGHRFDITTVSRHEEGTKNEKWTDVSKEVAAEVAAIWESEYGADWRNIFED
ncbi:hypothetical protein V502_03441 [Pseudogymnoascus sp. VKM F-4520 (FW-2644)]|nr:hypothetical protein V502_03441 [Pseudogymnoascus sp. VKM F-4520 (FW-2644)]